MKQVIYKYPLSAQLGMQVVEMPVEAEILDGVQVQNGVPCIWARIPVHCKDIVHNRVFVTVETGEYFEETDGDCLFHVGTYMLKHGELVYHLFVKLY